MKKKTLLLLCAMLFVVALMTACGSKKASDDGTSQASEKEEKPFSFSDVTWDTKKDEIVNVVGRKPDEEGETSTGGYSFYYTGAQFEGYKVEVNYVYESETLDTVILVFRDVDENDYNKLESIFNEKYGTYTEQGASKTWNSKAFNVSLDNTPLGFGMLKVAFVKP